MVIAHGLWQWPGVAAYREHLRRALLIWFIPMECWIHGSKNPIQSSTSKNKFIGGVDRAKFLNGPQQFVLRLRRRGSSLKRPSFHIDATKL